MLFDRLQSGSLEYCHYRFGHSKLLFRGPKPDFDRPYFLFLGSSETYGKFVQRPFSHLLHQAMDKPCANFANLNAGIDLYLRNPTLLSATARARVTVISVMGAHNLSNRLYTVHPRRNDRFVGASRVLSTLFRGVDLSEVHFTRHLLGVLRDADPVKFGIVVEELKSAWLARMQTLLEMIEGRTILLWMGWKAPPDPVTDPSAAELEDDPLFVDQAMIDEISPLVTQVVECVGSQAARATGTRGMTLSAEESAAAAAMPNPAFHKEVAAALQPVLGRMAG